MNKNLPNARVGRGGPFNWPSRSPDLIPLDFFLLLCLKDIVLGTPCNRLSQIRLGKSTAMRTIDENMLENIWEKT